MVCIRMQARLLHPFLEGATTGHVEVVGVAANAVPPWDKNFELHVATAMLNAISGGFVGVVAFSLTWEGDAVKVFEKAIANEQHEVAEKVYEIYPMLNPGGNLLVDLAARGRTDALNYFFDHGHKESSVLTRALELQRSYEVPESYGAFDDEGLTDASF